MAKEKVFTPDVIQDQPFPKDVEESQSVSQSTAHQTYSPRSIKDTAFPQKVIARELIGVSLNTKSRKILAEFEFEEKGALQIGKFVEDKSGDLKISPNGIVARNKDGDTTFALDGETGDAVFKGTIQAEDFVIADENGLVSAVNFNSDSYRSDDTVQISNTFSATVSGSTMSFSLIRPTRILITFFANVKSYAIDNFRAYHIDVGASIDDSNPFALGGDFARFEIDGLVANMQTCLSFAKTYLFSAGDHTISMKWAAFSDDLNELKTRGIDYCMLGS